MPKKNAAERRPERSFAGGRFEIKKAVATPADGALAVPDGSFSGYGSTFNEPHQTSSWMLGPDWQDVMLPGAFKRTLGEHKKRGSRPAMFFDHDMDAPIGVWDRVEEDKTGLATDGRLCLDVDEIAETYALMKFGAIGAESIGFIPAIVELDEKTKTRSIIEVDLIEISVVTLPGNPGAQISDVKSLRDFDIDNIRDVERALREGRPFSAGEAKRLVAGGFKALTSPRDVDEDEAKREQQAFENAKKILTGK